MQEFKDANSIESKGIMATIIQRKALNGNKDIQRRQRTANAMNGMNQPNDGAAWLPWSTPWLAIQRKKDAWLLLFKC
jgi:hypothetical protein